MCHGPASLQPCLNPAPHPHLPAQVDCVNSALGYGSAGCNGGYSSDVLSYVQGFRATTEADYRCVVHAAVVLCSACCAQAITAQKAPWLPATVS